MVRQLLLLCLVLAACSKTEIQNTPNYFEYCPGQHISINGDSILPFFTVKVREDLTDGIWIGRFPNERWLLFRGEVQNGQRIGKWETFWPNGQVCYQVHYKNGLLHGSWKAFSAMGNLFISGQLENDQYSGTWNQYDSLGNVITSKQHHPKISGKAEFSALEMAKAVDTALKDNVKIHYSQKAGYNFGMETVPNNVPVNFSRTVSGLSSSYYKCSGVDVVIECLECFINKALMFEKQTGPNP